MLDRIQGIPMSKEHHLVNLSLGPELSIDHNEVHAWTAVLATLSIGLVVAEGFAGLGKELGRMGNAADVVESAYATENGSV